MIYCGPKVTLFIATATTLGHVMIGNISFLMIVTVFDV